MNLRQLVERGDRPFASHPQVGRYFPAAAIEDARQRLARSIERGDGPGVVIGAAGSGKSLLVQVLAAQYRDKFDVVLLACAQLCTRRALLQAIHFELGLDYRRRDEGELRLSLLDQLLSGDEATQGLLLLVDEAQALPVHLLEELRLLTNLARGGAPRVRLVLAGMPTLEEKLASPELQSFSQRLSARCYLTSLTRAETAQYIRAQLAASSAGAERLFASTALEAVFNATDGVPRLVNQLCDRALTLADARRLDVVDAAVIQAAWSDLQQLPTAWESPQQTASPTTANSGVVEFGSLDEEVSPVRLDAAVVAAAAVSSRPASDDMTELDEEPATMVVSCTTAAAPPPPQPMPVRRPRVFSERVPDAVDPFAEPFEEEELVLESFATLASIFGARTPQVENRHDPGFSRLVQRALDASSKAVTKELVALEATRYEPGANASELDRPAIRLAVVHESQRAEPEPVPAADVADAILVIEDDPTGDYHTQRGVRRENYRQLFSRLRRGT